MLVRLLCAVDNEVNDPHAEACDGRAQRSSSVAQYLLELGINRIQGQSNMIAPVITVSSELIFCGNIADVLKIDIKGPPPRAAVISALGANPTLPLAQAFSSEPGE